MQTLRDIDNRPVLKDKKVLVVGLARTGLSVARFLVKAGAEVTVTDLRPESEMDGVEFLREMDISVETDGHEIGTFLSKDIIIISPGVPYDMPYLVEARTHGIETISEIELAGRFIDAPIVAVTGTNGKTTTATILGRIFKRAGKDVFVGGNIGLPLIESLTLNKRPDCIIAEVSSFQLEGVRLFRPDVAILLNVTEDHMDRHPDLDTYADIKFRIFSNQRKNDLAIVNIGDPEIGSRLGPLKSRIVPFSSATPMDKGIYYEDGEIIYAGEKGKEVYGTAGYRLRGIGNIENIMAAIAAARTFDIQPAHIQAAIGGFSGLPHRMELVLEKRGITFYDDSKATNVGALLSSLKALEGPIILIAGGKDKGGNYSVLRPHLEGKVKLMILLGEAREKIKCALSGSTETVVAESLEDAVEAAYSRGVAGDAVVLSPACSSFDMFRGYEERGEVFKRLVKAL